MPHVEITQPDPETGGTRVVIDGADLSRSIRHVAVEFDGPKPARVTVELGLVEDQRLCMADAELVIGEETTALLKRHGWHHSPGRQQLMGSLDLGEGLGEYVSRIASGGGGRS